MTLLLRPQIRLLLHISMAAIYILVLMVVTEATIGRHVGITRQAAPLITLQTSKGLVETDGPVSALITSPNENETIYMVNGITGNVGAYKSGPAKSYRPFISTAGPLALHSSGYMAYVDADSNIVLADHKGKLLRKLKTPPAISLALLSNGNIVVASPTQNHFLHLYKPDGQLLKSFGSIKERSADQAESLFLHKGKVLVDAADNIYYVYSYLPLIQKFSPTGEPEREIQVEGGAIDLQQELAQRFFSIREPDVVGGITIINSGTIDRKTGHLWIGLNGSSITGTVYEYAANGKKLREYALEVISPSATSKVITGVRDIAITSSELYVLTNEYQVLEFERNARPALRTTNQLDGGIQTEGHSIKPVAWTTAGGKLVWGRQTCGTDQNWPNCPFTCPGPACNGSTPTTTSSNGAQLDCKTSLSQALVSPYVVVQSNCTQYSAGTMMHMRGGCLATVRICKNGMNSDHSMTIDCQAPNCSGGGGGGSSACLYISGSNGFATDYQTYPIDGCEDGFCDNGGGCCISAGSPILIDILGNGFNLTGVDNPVSFDITGGGTPWITSWTAINSDDAFLVLDRNGNGTIDNGTELFGNYTPQPEPLPQKRNGFIALAEYDRSGNGGNGDGKIDTRDTIFSSLRLWQDTNHNGISEAGELHTLQSLNIESVDLDYKTSKRTDEYGNRFKYRAKVDDARHSHAGRWAWDIFFVKQR
jgi:hypothetical protein